MVLLYHNCAVFLEVEALFSISVGKVVLRVMAGSWYAQSAGGLPKRSVSSPSFHSFLFSFHSPAKHSQHRSFPVKRGFFLPTFAK